MNQKIALFLLAISASISAWIYWGSDVKTEQIITSREWHSSMSAYLAPSISTNKIINTGQLSKIIVNSNVKYLPNGTYLRESQVDVFNNNEEVSSRVSVSEVGQWELSADYLLISPTEFKNMATDQSLDSEVNLIEQLFIMDAQQSRRIDIINNKAILLTSLSHGSRILSSN